MSLDPIQVTRFYRGLQTREAEEGGASADRFVTFQNVRVGNGPATRRAGSAQIAYPGTDHTSVDLNGTTQYFRVPLDTRVHTLGLFWTWECLIQPDVVNASMYIFGEEAAGPTSGLLVRLTAAGVPEVVVTMSDGTAHTMTSATAATAAAPLGLQVTRSTSTLILRQNNAVKVTVTGASATLLCRAPTNNITIGRHNGGSYWDGKLDYMRAFKITRADHADYRMRWTDQECGHLLYNYTGELDAQLYMRDHSLWEAHAKGVNTPTETTALAIQDACGQAIYPYVDRQGRQRMAYAAGGRLHLVSV